MSHARVVNVRAPGAAWDVYIGRGRCPRIGVPGGWGNPFRFEEHGREAMRLFLDYVAKSGDAYLDAVRTQLPGKRLGCWCAPKPCHGEVLARLADGEPLATIRADMLRAVGLVDRPRDGLFYANEIRGLSLTQPWSTLVAIKAKRYETRGWSTPYRGWLAIHASKGFPRECRDLCSLEPFVSALDAAGFRSWKDLPRGEVLCTAKLGDVFRTDSPLLAIDHPEGAFGDYGPDRFAFELRDVKRLRKPVPAKGALGLWTVSPELRAAIDQELALRRLERAAREGDRMPAFARAGHLAGLDLATLEAFVSGRVTTSDTTGAFFVAWTTQALIGQQGERRVDTWSMSVSFRRGAALTVWCSGLVTIGIAVLRDTDGRVIYSNRHDSGWKGVAWPELGRDRPNRTAVRREKLRAWALTRADDRLVVMPEVASAWAAFAIERHQGPAIAPDEDLEDAEADPTGCVCEFPTCNGTRYLHCSGCGGDFCVCTCGGESECFGCEDCRTERAEDEDEFDEAVRWGEDPGPDPRLPSGKAGPA